jgi:hypothetical protein
MTVHCQTASDRPMAVQQGSVVYFAYAFVAFKGTVLAESGVASETSDKNRDLLLNGLSAADPSTPRFQSESASARYLFLVEPSGVAYACVSHPTMSEKNGFEFLTNLQSRWVRTNGSGSTAASPQFGSVEISAMLRSYNSAQYDKIAAIRDNLADAQRQTTHNLSLALERGEAIDTMSDKAIELQSSAQTFHRQATDLKRQMCCHRYMWWFLGAGILAGIVVVIVVVATTV